MSHGRDKFGEQYFEFTSNYPRAILRGRRIGLKSRFWLRYIKKRKRGGRLLDIGCGKGFFLERAEKSYETYGIDISEYAIEQAHPRLHNTKLYIGDADQLDFDRDYFDIITCFDLLEHLDSPELAIKKCYLILREGGLFIFRVPNTDSYGLRWLKENWHGHRDQTHVSLLSNEEWGHLLEENGFRIIDRFYDGLWDSPYFKVIPAFIQHIFFKLFFTVLFPLLGILGIKLPAKWGENVILVSIKQPIRLAV